jgi:hypothetical protein
MVLVGADRDQNLEPGFMASQERLIKCLHVGITA